MKLFKTIFALFNDVVTFKTNKKGTRYFKGLVILIWASHLQEYESRKFVPCRLHVGKREPLINKPNNRPKIL